MANRPGGWALKLSTLFGTRADLLRLQREVDALRRENAELRAQNDSMRDGMRRCVTCEYRIDYKRRQSAAPTHLSTSEGD